MARRDRPPREQGGRREHQHLQGALDVGRALRQQPRRQHVQLALARPADDVAPRRRVGHPSLERQPRLRRVELRVRPVEHHGQLPEPHLEQPLEPRAAVLELRQDAFDVRAVLLVVPGDEGL